MSLAVGLAPPTIVNEYQEMMMKRSTELTIGVAAAALTIAGPAAATVNDQPIPPAASYADLFDHVADASSRLTAADEAMTANEGQYAAPYGAQAHHHHHHHHHHHSRRWYRAHGYVWNGGGWVMPPPPPPPMAHHHHHHHHHHSNF